MRSSTKKARRDYTGQSIFVGIDMHLKSWTVSPLSGDEKPKAFHMSEPSTKKVDTHLKERYPGGTYIVIYEAGYCGYWAQREFEKLGIRCIVTHAADIPTTEKEKRMKNDKRDAKKLARCLKTGEYTKVYVPTEAQEYARDLVRERYDLAAKKRSQQARIKMYLHKKGIELPKTEQMQHWSKRFMAWLYNIEQERSDRALASKLRHLQCLRDLEAEATREVRKLAKTDAYAEDVRYLTSAPGIGLLTSMLLITELIDIHRFKTLDQICSFIGLCPSTNSSGDKERVGKMSKRGNTRARCAIIESAWIAKRYDPVLGQAYDEWKIKTTKSNKAIVKVARKLLNRLRFVWKNKTDYEKGYSGQRRADDSCSNIGATSNG